MWLFLFFDLPQVSLEEKQQAAKFRNYLLNDGYMMMQWSVYARVCNGDERVEVHQERVKEHLPPEGNVRVLKVTDKQYGAMKLLLGNKKPNERKGAEQLMLF